MNLNWNYTKTPTGLIQLGEIVSFFFPFSYQLFHHIFFFQILAFIGGLFMAIFDGNGFWAFVFWSNVIITSLIIGLNVFEILPKLQAAFSYTDKVVNKYFRKTIRKN